MIDGCMMIQTWDFRSAGFVSTLSQARPELFRAMIREFFIQVAGSKYSLDLGLI